MAGDDDLVKGIMAMTGCNSVNVTETGLKMPGIGRLVIPEDVTAYESALIAALVARVLIPRRVPNFSDVAKFITDNKLERFVATVELATELPKGT